MAGSNYGNIFKITTWGESHGKALGVVIDGCPAGLSLSEEDIQPFLDLRKPGQSKFTTKRTEDDLIEILSGVFEGKTTGTPISLIVKNTSQISKDYSNIMDIYRPGHADYTFDEKFGFRDYRGGGRSSGRETIGRVAAGAVAVKVLKELGITFSTYTKAIGDIEISDDEITIDEVFNNKLYMPNKQKAKEAEEYLDKLISEGNSVGGKIECKINGMKAGVGEPVFEKLDANIAKGVMSIGAVKAVEIGKGCDVAKSTGDVNNDNFRNTNGLIEKVTNNAGGILGGISDGDEIIVRASIKPTPSIYSKQNTVNNKGENVEIQIKGRHDPVIVPRAVIVVESMIAVTILDMMLMGMGSKLENLKKIYE